MVIKIKTEILELRVFKKVSIQLTELLFLEICNLVCLGEKKGGAREGEGEGERARRRPRQPPLLLRDDDRPLAVRALSSSTWQKKSLSLEIGRGGSTHSWSTSMPIGAAAASVAATRTPAQPAAGCARIELAEVMKAGARCGEHADSHN